MISTCVLEISCSLACTPLLKNSIYKSNISFSLISEILPRILFGGELRVQRQTFFQKINNYSTKSAAWNTYTVLDTRIYVYPTLILDAVYTYVVK